MVSFRLTADEYERFRDLCSTCGSRNVSELARGAIYSLREQSAQVPRDALEFRLTELESKVNMLRMELRKLRQSVRSQALDQTTAAVSDS